MSAPLYTRPLEHQMVVYVILLAAGVLLIVRVWEKVSCTAETLLVTAAVSNLFAGPAARRREPAPRVLGAFLIMIVGNVGLAPAGFGPRQHLCAGCAGSPWPSFWSPWRGVDAFPAAVRCARTATWTREQPHAKQPWSLTGQLHTQPGPTYPYSRAGRRGLVAAALVTYSCRGSVVGVPNEYSYRVWILLRIDQNP